MNLGDIYSFALIASEILNMKPVWVSWESVYFSVQFLKEGDDTKRDYEDVIYMVKKGGRNPLRPNLEPVAQDISPALVDFKMDLNWNFALF